MKDEDYIDAEGRAFNRTIVELKSATPFSILSALCSFNRTIVELK